MRKLLKLELSLFVNELVKLDTKIIAILFGSTILFTLSWYFASPVFFNEIFSFHQSFDPIIEDFISFNYWFFLDSTLFLVIPFLIIKFLFQENIMSYGVSLGNFKLGLAFTILSIIMFVPIIYFVSISENFSQYFPLMQSAKDDLTIFIIYELLLLIFLFSWEFIFRGFMLFGLEKRFGLYSIFFQMIPFVILHNGKPFIETFASIFGGIILGYLAIRTRSIIYGFLIHAFILICLDVLSYIKV